MSEVNVGVRRRVVTTPKYPNAPTNLALSQRLSPNPQPAAFMIAWTAATVPAGGDSVGGYKVYLNNTHVKTVSGTTELTLGNDGTITPSTIYAVAVSAFNSFGESAKATLSVTTAAPVAAPDPVTSLTAPTKTTASVSLSWVVSGSTPSCYYEVYSSDSVDPLVTTAAGATTATVTSLTQGTPYTFSVKAVNVNGTSVPATIAVTTNVSSSLQLMRSDDVLNYNGFNVKATYPTGTYGNTSANATRVIELATSMGFRVYRESVGKPGTPATRQLAFIKAMNAAWGTKFHATIGNMKNAGGFNVPTMDAETLRVHASSEVKTQIDRLVAMNQDTQLAALGSIGKWLHSIAGPNEVETQSLTGPNWALHARIWQEALWNAVRFGKFWNAVYTKSGSTYTITRAGTAFVADNTRSTWPTLFANIPVTTPSMRSDIDKSGNTTKPTTLAGTVVNTTTGLREMGQWCDAGNIHLYQAGGSPHARISTFADLMQPCVPVPGYVDPKDGSGVHFVASETGYNTMGFDLDGTDINTDGFATNSGPDGSTKAPSWVTATFAVRAIANYAQKNIEYMRHEFINDDDRARDASGTLITPTRYAWDIQSWFGIVHTPAVDPATWVPMADYYAIRRFMNILKDRSVATNPPTFTPSHFPLTVTNANGCQVIETQKSDGSTWLLIWRDVDFYIDNLSGTNPRIAYVSGGTEISGMRPSVNCTIQLNHTSGNKTPKRFRPNKAVWSGTGTTSTGHDDASDWATEPTPDQTWTVAAGATFNVSVGVNLELIKLV